MNKKQPKYIIYSDQDKVIIFSDLIQHSTFNHLEPKSAGFVGFNENGTVQAYGESITLDLKSRKEDSDIIARELGMNFKEWM